MIEIYIVEINKDLDTGDFYNLLSFVSEKKKERIQRFHRFEDAQRSLIGEVLSRYAICKRIGCRNKDLIFDTNEYGKPILLTTPEIYFNISHSGKWVVCAIDNNPIGIDVEVIKPISLNIAERFFSPSEYLALLNQPKEMRQKYFYMIWTLKESYIKAEGKGLNIPLNSFKMILDNSSISAIRDNKKTSYNFYQSFLNDTAIYAICYLGGSSQKVSTFSTKEILQDVRILLSESF